MSNIKDIKPNPEPENDSKLPNPGHVGQPKVYPLNFPNQNLKFFLLHIFYDPYLGQNPERFPYAEDDGMGNIKQCCGNKTYNPFTFTCCEDQVMEIGSC